MRTQRTSSDTSAPITSSRLNSWKEIAAFFDKDVRTVRRWEVERKMPVYRVPGGPRSGVYAYVQELERWLHREEERPSRQKDAVTPPEAPDLNTLEPAPPFPRHIRLLASIVFCLAMVWFAYARLHAPHQTRPGQSGKTTEAQDLCLRARYFWNLRTEDGLKQALSLFSQAAERDPRSAAAYAGIADSYILIRQYGHMPDSEAFPLALQASKKALTLDPNSFEAHRSYAFILNYWLWNFRESEREFLKVLDMRPDDALAHHWYATSLYSTGRYQDALEQIEIARKLQPESISVLANRDLLLAQTDQQAAFADLLQLEIASPSFPPIHTYLADIYLSRGDTDQFLAETALAASLSGDLQRSEILRSTQTELSAHGPRAALKLLATQYGNLADNGVPDAMAPASYFARLGETQQAVHYLTLACRRHESTFLRVGHDGTFGPLSTDSRFQELLQRRNTVVSDETGVPAVPAC